MSYQAVIERIDKKTMPQHVAIIMDGNGRWAKKHGLERLKGHYMGRKTVRRIVECAVELGLMNLTIYAFSTENWRRPHQEVKGLLKLIMNSLLEEVDDLAKNNVAIRFIGADDKLDEKYRAKALKTCEATWKNTGLNLNVAMNYGGRAEIIHAVNACLAANENIKKITADDLQKHLYTAAFPDPDLLIRTSGELRLSNFLIWQSAYSELWFTDTLWPEFSKQEFCQAIYDYQQRQRRFGASE